MYASGMWAYYEWNKYDFVDDFTLAIETGDSSLIDKYRPADFDSKLYKSLSEKQAYFYGELAYEWETLTDNIQNIKSVDFIQSNSTINKNYVLFSQVDCHLFTYNGNTEPHIICVRQSYGHTNAIIIQ